MVRCRPSTRTYRGQALVETALVLPILAVLMVMALDFGRVFFGWIALQNAARIGADFAATVPDAWDTPGEPTNRNRYVQLVEDDLEGINCTLADGGAIPDPNFEDIDGNGEADDDGDYAIVELHCEFALITPLAEGILGGPVAMAAHEEFPINVRHLQGVPPPPPPPPECIPPNLEVPDLVGLTMGNARDLWVGEGFDEDNFEPPVISTGPPSGRNVNKIVDSQDLDADDCVADDSTIHVTFIP
jgi:TadE-like protein